MQLKINGKVKDKNGNETIQPIEVGLTYGMISVEVLSKMNGSAGKSDIANIVKIIWAGIENYYFIKDTPIPVTFEDVVDYVEQITFEGDSEGVVGKVLLKFTESRPVKQLIDRSESLAEDAKKNLTATSTT